MAKILKTALETALNAPVKPRLVVINSSTVQGRYSQMFRVRPTLLARARTLAVGPIYLILEHALEKLLDELEAMPEGTLLSLDAHTMDPGPEDKEMLLDMHHPRAQKPKAKKVAEDEVRTNPESQ